MVHEQGGRHGLGELRGRVGLDPHAALLQDHVALRRHDALVEQEVRHPVGFERHHRLEVFPGDALEIGRVVEGREGVLLASETRHHLREGPGRVLLRALEHQVLEEVGNAGLALRIVRGPVAVPHHVRHHRHAVIGDHHHVEAVVQGEGRQFRPAALRPPGNGSIGAQVLLGACIHVVQP